MERTIPSAGKNMLQTYAELVARMNIAAKLGMSYGTDRNLYQALGYATDFELDFSRFYAQYKRQDIAKAIIDRPVNATWRGELEIIESDDDNETALEKAWKELRDKLKLKSKFKRLDKLTGIGHYGVLLMGTKDARKKEDFALPIKAGTELIYVKPISEANANIKQYEDNVNNPRYGLPKVYTVTLTLPGGNTTSEITVHHSRVLHVMDEQLESEIEGTPRLEVVFNRLQDLEKLVGGSAEMFWRGARPGYSNELKEGFMMTPKAEADLQAQIDEYEHNLRRILKLEGTEMKPLESQVSDPSGHVDVQLQMISAVTGIPKRILTGSERGELSSTQDQDEWDTWVQTRREEFAESQIIRPFVDWCIEHKVLPAPKDKYKTKWSDLFAQSEKEKAEVGRVRAEALAKYAGSPMAEGVVPPEAFLNYFLGFDAEQIEMIKEMLEAHIDEEEELMGRVEEELAKIPPVPVPGQLPAPANRPKPPVAPVPPQQRQPMRRTR